MRLVQVGRETLSRKFTVGTVWNQEPWRMGVDRLSLSKCLLCPSPGTLTHGRWPVCIRLDIHRLQRILVEKAGRGRSACICKLVAEGGAKRVHRSALSVQSVLMTARESRLAQTRSWFQSHPSDGLGAWRGCRFDILLSELGLKSEPEVQRTTARPAPCWTDLLQCCPAELACASHAGLN